MNWLGNLDGETQIRMITLENHRGEGGGGGYNERGKINYSGGNPRGIIGLIIEG